MVSLIIGPLILLGLLGLLVLVGLAALRWGVDSTDGADSPEWERRRNWRSIRRS
jgi:hypothetical protein